MVLIVLAGWGTRITDVEGAFLNGSFQKVNQKVYTTVHVSTMGVVIVISNNVWYHSRSTPVVP